jgi:CRISPR-associated protein Csm1
MQNLEKFVSHNPDIRLSGGLAFIHGKYPIHEAARDAGNAEARSKSAGRNRFTFLDVTSTWQTFLEIQNKCERLNEIIAEGGARSLLQLLQHLGQMERAAQLRTGEKRVWGPWMWQTDYHLSQAINRANQPSLKQKLSALHEIIRQEMYDGNKLQDWGTAARWAQLLIRETR